MSNSNMNVTFEDILDKASLYIEDSNQIDVIKKAYQFALDKHSGQLR